MIKIYHNNRCSKSRNVLQILQNEGIPFEVINYLETKPNVAELKLLLKKAGIKAEAMIRKNEALFKEQYKGQMKTNEEWVDILAAHPILIERPIIETDTNAMICRPPELVYELLRQ